jgi:hypothetical protein
MKYTVIPCRYALDSEKRLISITPMLGNFFPSNTKLNWIKDFYSHSIGNPRKLKSVSSKVIEPVECLDSMTGKTYLDLLTEPLPVNGELYRYELNGEFWIVALNRKESRD